MYYISYPYMYILHMYPNGTSGSHYMRMYDKIVTLKYKKRQDKRRIILNNHSLILPVITFTD